MLLVGSYFFRMLEAREISLLLISLLVINLASFLKARIRENEYYLFSDFLFWISLAMFLSGVGLTAFVPIKNALVVEWTVLGMSLIFSIAYVLIGVFTTPKSEEELLVEEQMFDEAEIDSIHNAIRQSQGNGSANPHEIDAKTVEQAQLNKRASNMDEDSL